MPIAHRIFVLLLVAALPALATSATGPGVVGTWTLISATATDEHGNGARALYGRKPTGMLIYNADGTMSATISYEGRKPLSVVDREGAPAAERAEAFASFIAYAGRYRVTGNRIAHRVEVGSVQNWVGTDLVRELQVSGDRLTLRTSPTRIGSQLQIVELVWERAHAAR